jgi:hypothetical protein
MPIQRSAGAEIKLLIEAIAGSDDTAREAAVARLAIIGPRAVERLLQEFAGGTTAVRLGALRALEAIADPRALTAARSALHDGSPLVQAAAIGTLRALAAGASPAARDAFDALVATVLDRRRSATIRLAAWDALGDTSDDARESLRRAVADDPDPEFAGGLRRRGGSPPSDAGTWEQAVAGQLPALPAPLKTALAAHGSGAPLASLQRLIDHVRVREDQEADPHLREQWRALRGALHQTLAARGSRLALYDLRDSFLTSDRLPGAFLAAIEEIGDATCLDQIAAAYDFTSRSGDTWVREHLASAFRAILRREGLTRRHAAVKRVLARWPDAATALLDG